MQNSKRPQVILWFITHYKLSGFLTFLLLSIGTSLITYQRYHIIKENERREMASLLNVISQNIEQTLKNGYATALTLALTIDDKGNPIDFEGISEKILKTNTNIDIVQLVPDGIIKYSYPLKDNEDVIEALADRIEGRTSLHDVFNPLTNELMVGAGEEIMIDVARAMEDAGIETVDIRSVLTCESKRGVCVSCYGRNLATGYVTQKGDAVGIIAAQSIGEPGTQLTLRTFHVGGVAGSSSVESSLNAKFDGTIQFDGLRTVDTINNDGNKVKVVIGRTGEVRIMDVKNDRLMITNNVPYGALLAVKDGAQVKKGDVICTWDPFNNVVVAEQNGKIKFENIIIKTRIILFIILFYKIF